MNRKSSILLVTATSLLGFVACGGGSGGGVGGEAQGEAGSVRATYAKVGDLTRTTLPALATVDVLATGEVSEIANRRYFDLVTFYPAEQVQLATAVKQEASGLTHAYTITWTDEGPQGTAAPDLTLRQVWEMAQGDPASSSAASVPLDDSASYVLSHVQLQLDGRTRSYQALEITSRGESIFLDPVLWMMNQVAREQLPPAIGATVHPLQVAGGPPPPPPPQNCNPTQWTNPTPVVSSQTGTDWHITGFHSAISSSNFQCNCAADCTSTCTPLGSSTATETGVFTPQPGLGWWHASNQSRMDVPGAGQPGAGSTCDSAGGAVVKNCLFGVFCDVKIGFSVTGVGIGVTLPTGIYPASVWVSASSTLRGTCAACPPIPAPAPMPMPMPMPAAN
jgi:hypothetical protein